VLGRGATRSPGSIRRFTRRLALTPCAAHPEPSSHAGIQIRTLALAPSLTLAPTLTPTLALTLTLSLALSLALSLSLTLTLTPTVRPETKVTF
jgi:serine/threonine-protein kinase ATR